jgi:16S rRNA (cytidine1402-2'-O)-methyltransferase
LSVLTLVTLPIGNIDDLSARAKGHLEDTSRVFCEDTRKFGQFMKRAGITKEGKQLTSFHDHSQDKISRLIEQLDSGHDCSIVSDAGSPVISDPAFPLIREALKKGHEINSIPGVSSAIVALELSGLPPQPFHFYGFLPRQGLEEYFDSISGVAGTHLFFESPMRIKQTCQLLAEKYPESQIAILKELTKTYQSVYRFAAKNFSEIENDITYKGEFILAFHIDKVPQVANKTSKKLVGMAEEIIEKGSSKKRLAKILGLILDKDTRDVYSKLIDHP